MSASTPDSIGTEASPTLDEARDFLAGRASAEVRERVGAAIRNPDSELRRFLEGVRDATKEFLGGAE